MGAAGVARLVRCARLSIACQGLRQSTDTVRRQSPTLKLADYGGFGFSLAGFNGPCLVLGFDLIAFLQVRGKSDPALDRN